MCSVCYEIRIMDLDLAECVCLCVCGVGREGGANSDDLDLVRVFRKKKIFSSVVVRVVWLA